MAAKSAHVVGRSNSRQRCRVIAKLGCHGHPDHHVERLNQPLLRHERGDDDERQGREVKC
jgi:hypothetical protein